MAGDYMSSYAHRAGWITDSGHRERTSGVHARTRFAPSATPVSDFRLTLPARAENVAVVRRMLEGVADVVGLPDEVLEDVRLAVTEACTNVVRHAYSEGNGTIDVVASPQDEVLEVVIADEGRGMGPSPDTSGPGLGLPLMSALAYRVELRPGRRGGSRVAMSFRLGAA